MKIDKIILGCNENLDYLSCLPLVARAWERLLDIEPTIGLISEDDGIPTANHAQIIRVLLAARYPDDWCLLSDADMLPLQSEYFIRQSEYAEEGKILSMSSDAYSNAAGQPHYNTHPICYLLAKGRDFERLFSRGDLDMVSKWKDGKNPFVADFSDEMMLYDLIQQRDIEMIKLQRGWSSGIANNRIDRSAWRFDMAKLNRGEYIDAHLPRPVTPGHKVNLLVDPIHNPCFR